MKNNTLQVLFCIIFLFLVAFSIRIYKVASAPSGVLIDEASIGYNAYSLLKTGKDEYGISYPLIFKAFGDQKLPLYIYLVIPSVKYFGLTAFSVRLPSLLAGSFLPIIIFFLLLELKLKKRVSFLGGMITALSPWTIILSRFGYESTIGLLFFSLGILFAFISIRKKNIYFSILGGICLGLTLYSYIAYRFITPFIVLSFLLIKNKKNEIGIRFKLILIVSFLLTLLPLTQVLLNPQSSARFSQVGLSYSSGLKMEIDENRTFCSKKIPKFLCFATSNKVLFMTRMYLYRFIDTFSPSYLFLSGNSTDPTVDINNFGLFYVWLLPFYIAGLFGVYRNIKKKGFFSVESFIIIGLLVSSVPSLLVGSPHKLRLSGLFPFMVIVITTGISYLEVQIHNIKLKRFYYISLYIALIISTLFFIILFLTVHIQKYEVDFRTYVPKLMTLLGGNKDNKQIYIKSITEGLIYYAFVNKVDPLFYQNNIVRGQPDSIGFIHSTDLSNIHIISDELPLFFCKNEKNKSNILYVSNENIKNISSSSKHIIYSENGVDTLAIVYDLNKISSDEILCPRIL